MLGFIISKIKKNPWLVKRKMLLSIDIIQCMCLIYVLWFTDYYSYWVFGYVKIMQIVQYRPESTPHFLEVRRTLPCSPKYAVLFISTPHFLHQNVTESLERSLNLKFLNQIVSNMIIYYIVVIFLVCRQREHMTMKPVRLEPNGPDKMKQWKNC